jgi:hypothetical protein
MSDEPTVAEVERHLVAGVQVPARPFGSLPLPATGTEVAQFVALRAVSCSNGPG